MNMYSHIPQGSAQPPAPGAGVMPSPIRSAMAGPVPAATLPVDHLAAYGFPPEVIFCWKAGGVQTLLPLQSELLTHTGLLRGSNLVVQAPTSAGKTFIGEMAAVRHWQAGRKTIFLCPTRALVAEQYRHLHARYHGLGIRTVMATADHTVHDQAIRRGDFDFAVMVYEKLRAFVCMSPEILYSVGAVVADELQILSDPGRGEAADLLLTRLVRAEPRVQVIGMSAVMHSADTLAQWLDAELHTTVGRPVELREGVYCMEHRAYHYQCGPGAAWADEALPVARGASAAGLPAGHGYREIIGLCVGLARAGENCLVFVPTRALSRQLCGAIAGELGLPRDGGQRAAHEELRQAEESLVRTQLMECMPAGVAFHNSDLTADLRGMVEQAFEAGELRVLVATPTLAQGVNLRAQNVVQVPLMLRGDGATMQNRPAHVPLAVARYRNQAGRAGRVGGGAAYGRSIIVASGHLEAERLARTYVQAAPEAVSRSFSDHNMDHFVLECVQSGLADTYSGIHAALAHTHAWHSGAVAGGTQLEDQLAESVRGLLDMKLLDETSGHRLRITGSGQAMAAGGYRAHTIREMLSWCAAWQHRAPHPFEILCACAFTADGEDFALSATAPETRTNAWKRAAQEIIEADGICAAGELDRVMDPPGGMSQEGHASLKKAVVCLGWISDCPTAELESRYRLVAGTIAAAAAHLAWLAGGLASCAAVVQCSDAVSASIRDVANRLPRGLAAGAGRLSQLQVAGMSRYYLNRLAAEGFETPKALFGAPEEALRNVLPGFLVARIKKDAAVEAADETEETDEMEVSETPSELVAEKPLVYEPASAEPVINGEHIREAFERPAPAHDLVLDPADPGAVTFYGKTLRLPPKPYALLSLLAQRCGRTVPYRSIDEIVWQDEKVEPQQISAHKSRLIKELGKAATPEQAEAAIVTDPRFGLRLNLEPGRVKAGHR